MGVSYSLTTTITAEISTQTTMTICMAIQKGGMRGIGSF